MAKRTAKRVSNVEKKRSEAAHKGWLTRRKNEQKREREAKRLDKENQKKFSKSRKPSKSKKKKPVKKPRTSPSANKPVQRKVDAKGRSVSHVKGWVTRRRRSAQTKHLQGLDKRKRTGRLTAFDKAYLDSEKIRERIALGGRGITDEELTRLYGLRRRDGTIAVSWSRMRALAYVDEAEIKERIDKSGGRFSEGWYDEIREIAEEYDVSEKEVRNFFFS